MAIERTEEDVKQTKQFLNRKCDTRKGILRCVLNTGHEGDHKGFTLRGKVMHWPQVQS
jgi:hypothetical protein